MRSAIPPTPTRDLDSPEEIAEMVRRFYADVAMDDLLGPIFNDVAQVDWSAHLPKLTAFWCRVILSLPGYSGNPFRAHADVHERRSFTTAHFERWLDLFEETLELGWVGPNAARARQLAHDVARVHHDHLVRPIDASRAEPEQCSARADATGVGSRGGSP